MSDSALIRGGGVRRAAPIAIAALAVALAIAAHVFVAWGSVTPIFYTDEVGYLANAQLMAGVGVPRDFSASSYYIGWSVVLVPLWWVSSNPQTVYLGAIAISVACGIALIWPLALIARRLGVVFPWAVVAAAAVSVAPARLVMSNFALAENFMALLVACAVLAAMRYAESATLGRAATLTAFAAYLFLTHARTAPILVATLLWIVIHSWRRWRLLIVSVVVIAVVTIPGFLLYRHLASLMYVSGGVDREERGFTRLTDLDPFAAFTATVGQLWYLTAAWYGLALLGLLLVVASAYKELRSKKFGISLWGVIVFLGVLGVSVIWIAAAIARGDTRSDIYAYGRYLDTILFVFAIVGIAAVVRGLSRRVALAWVIATVAIGAAFFLIVYRQIPVEGAWYGPNSVPGLIQWNWPLVTDAIKPPWVIATIVGGVFVVVLAVIARVKSARVRVVTSVLILLIAYLASGIAAEVKTIRPTYDAWYSSFTLRTTIHHFVELYPDASISFDTMGLSDTLGGEDTVSRNAYQYWLTPRALPVFTSVTNEPTTDLVISRKEWPAGEALGAKLVAVDTGLFDNALWVMPGALQERMAAAGELAR